MSATNDGGPAFPRSGTDTSCSQKGMSLRDWFAGQALAGLLARPDISWSDETIVQSSYQYADAMLRAQKGGAK